MHPIRPLSSADSLQGLTSLLHRAYERVGEMGLNYTTVDRSVEVTAERIAGGQCYIAEMDGRLVGTIVVKPTEAQSECEYYRHVGFVQWPGKVYRSFVLSKALQSVALG